MQILFHCLLFICGTQVPLWMKQRGTWLNSLGLCYSCGLCNMYCLFLTGSWGLLALCSLFMTDSSGLPALYSLFVTGWSLWPLYHVFCLHQWLMWPLCHASCLHQWFMWSLCDVFCLHQWFMMPPCHFFISDSFGPSAVCSIFISNSCGLPALYSVFISDLCDLPVMCSVCISELCASLHCTLSSSDLWPRTIEICISLWASHSDLCPSFAYLHLFYPLLDKTEWMEIKCQTENENPTNKKYLYTYSTWLAVYIYCAGIDD